MRISDWSSDVCSSDLMAIRGYTSREISPLIRAQMETRFLPHSVPSYAAQTNFRALTEKFPDYTYTEAALNPTNPSDRATDWEAAIRSEERRVGKECVRQSKSRWSPFH